MTINVNAQSLKNRINAANPNQLPQELQIINYGDVLRAGVTFLRRKTPVADAGSLATLRAIVLPDDAKASNISRAYARAGTGVIGEIAILLYGDTPGAGQIAVGPNGDIVTFAADAWTDLDVTYQPDKYDLAETTLSVVANVLTLPPAFTNRRAIMLLEVTATAGTALGKKVILIPGSGAPAAGQARLNFAKTTVTFAGADVVTQATVKITLVASVDTDALLTANSSVQ